MTPDALVADCAATLEPLERAANLAWWTANVDATPANQQSRLTADLAFSDARADAAVFTEIRAARATNVGDPLVARQLDLLEQTYAPHQIEPALRKQIVEREGEIDARFARHRGVIDGTEVDDNVIGDILRQSDDSAEREAAWHASKSVGPEVADDIRALVRLRNEAARALGYRDYFAMTLATTEFDEAYLFATLDEVDALTAKPFAVFKAALDEERAARFGVPAAALRPWHYDDPFFQDVPRSKVDLDAYLEHADLDALTARTFGGCGLAVEPMMSRSDLLPRAGKVQHAFCIDMDRAGDIRVLCNNTPGERWAETMLHEFGHAVYFDGVSRDLPWLLRTMHMSLTEGVAMRCGRLVHDPRWLRAVAGLPDAALSTLAPELRAAERARLLVFARWVLVMTNFERGLYADPDADHDTRWWDLVERMQLVHRPDGRHAPDWAAKIHIAVAPVYYHNYLFGELIAAQLQAAFGDLVDSPDTGAALAKRFFAPGATEPWDRHIEIATGSPLTPAVLARELAT